VGLLRLLLAVCVFCTHSRPLGQITWVSGTRAVEIFFIISGFYMQLVLSRKYTRDQLGETWVLQFYKARYFRLLPIYLTAFLLATIVGLVSRDVIIDTWRYVAGIANTPQNLLAKVFLCFTNLTMFFQDLTMFLVVQHGGVHWSTNFRNSEMLLWHGLAIPQAWSLGIELSFYIIAPSLLKLRTRWLVILLFCCLTAKVVVLLSFHLVDPWTYRFFPFELGYFVAGALVFRHRKRFDFVLSRHLEKPLVYTLAILFVVLPFQMSVIKFLYPLLIASALPLIFRITAGSNMDRLIGELSFPFYIYHWLALSIAGNIQKHWQLPVDSAAWIGLVVTLLLSVISLRLELRFVEPWRSRFAVRRQVTNKSDVFLSVPTGALHK
jgi:peptidoglycan/LPS O-acetylase OafA/YrhL